MAPEQALSRAEALRCATADLAVLSADPLTVAEPEIANISARMTMVGGKIVHDTPNWSG